MSSNHPLSQFASRLAASRRRSRRPALETLEDRVVPAFTITRDGGIFTVEVTSNETVQLSTNSFGSDPTVNVIINNTFVAIPGGPAKIDTLTQVVVKATGDFPNRLFGSLRRSNNTFVTIGFDGGGGNDILGDEVNGVGDDILIGGDGNDILIGGAGSDSLNGGEGNDTLIEGGTLGFQNQSDVNRLEGGPGDDVYVLDDPFLPNRFENFIVERIGEGRDRIEFPKDGVTDFRFTPDQFFGVTFDLASTQLQQVVDKLNFFVQLADGETDTAETIEDVNGTRMGDVLRGNGLGNILRGNVNDSSQPFEGRDELFGRNGNDTLQPQDTPEGALLDGGSGADTLFSTAGDDVLRGGNGGDVYGGSLLQGDDVIEEEPGCLDTDRFVFPPGNPPLFDVNNPNRQPVGTSEVNFITFGANDAIEQFGQPGAIFLNPNCIPPEQDLQVRRDIADEPFVGVNVRDRIVSDGQTSRQLTLPDFRTRFRVRIENTAAVARTFNLRREKDALAGFTVSYLRDGIDVTNAVNAGTFVTPSIAPGQAIELQVVIAAPANLAGNVQKAVALRLFESPTSTAVLDVVRVIATTELIVTTHKDVEDTIDDGVIDSDAAEPGQQLSLRDAIQFANAIPGEQRITFAMPGSSTIQLDKVLPAVTQAVILDATTQAGGKVELKGKNSGADEHGLQVVNANNVVLLGLVVNNFGGAGVVLQGGGNHRLERLLVGLNAAGTEAVPNGLDGVQILGSANNVVRDSTLSGNARHGVLIRGAASQGNSLLGNNIGTNAAGDLRVGNEDDGVRVEGDASENTIGGRGAADRNVISGNLGDGVEIVGRDTDFNKLFNNFIGLDRAGQPSAANGFSGVHLNNAQNTRVGDGDGEGNVISNNTDHGVLIRGAEASANRLFGNIIGLSPNAEERDGNGLDGVHIAEGARENEVGGFLFVGTERGNLIGGNARHGVALTGGATLNDVRENLIGTNADGDAGLGNGGAGVVIDGASSNRVGLGFVSNVISGNALEGVRIVGAASTGNLVRGNLIGLTPDQSRALPNAVGVRIDGARENVIGEDDLFDHRTTPGQFVPEDGNVIAGNGVGVHVTNGATLNRVQGNVIGTNAQAAVGLGNAGEGVRIDGAATENVVGLSRDGVALRGGSNVVVGSGTAEGEIVVAGAGTDGNRVAGNLVGSLRALDIATAFENAARGVAVLDGASGTVVGGETDTPGTGLGNVIAGFLSLAGGAASGVLVANVTTAILAGNVIGDVADDGVNDNGLEVVASGGVVVGGEGGTRDRRSPLGNLFRGNAGSGVVISGASLGNAILGNDFAVNGSALDIGNDHVTLLGAGVQATVIQANRFGGANVGGVIEPGAAGHGVAIQDASFTRIGGLDAEREGNLFSENAGAAVFVTGAAATANAVLGNEMLDNGFGIDLDDGPDRATPNDTLDLDDGPNGLFNFPVVEAVKFDSIFVQVTGRIDARPNTQLRLEFFQADDGPGAGRRFLFAEEVNSGPSGQVEVDFFAGAAGLAVGQLVTATATEISADGVPGSTSEFSPAVVVTVFEDTDGDGVANAIEEQAPDQDLDDDGVPDAEQPHAAALPAVKADGAPDLERFGGLFERNRQPLRGVLPFAVSPVAGFVFLPLPEHVRDAFALGFEASLAVPGGEAELEFALPDNVNHAGFFAQILGADRFFEFERARAIFFGPRQAFLKVKDGGPGDLDGVANGAVKTQVVFSTVPQADLQVQAEAEADEFGQALHKVRVTNLSNENSAPVAIVSDPLPADVTFVSASDGGTFDPVTRRVTFQLPIGVGPLRLLERELTLRSAVPGRQQVGFSLAHQVLSLDPNPANDAASSDVAIEFLKRITVRQDGGKVTVTGDDQGNDLKVEFGANGPNTVRISSKDSRLNDDVQAVVLAEVNEFEANLLGGNDVVSFVGNLGPNVGVRVSGGPGVDTLVAEADVNMTLRDRQLVAEMNVVLEAIEAAQLIGGAGNNRLDASGFSGPVTIDGGAGNDILIGGRGNDVLRGGPGFDTVVQAGNVNVTLTNAAIFAAGNDKFDGVENFNLIGGPGNNVFVLNGFTGMATVNGAGGTDTVVVVQNANMKVTNALLTTTAGAKVNLVSVEAARLTGGAANNTLDARGTTRPVTLQGLGGNDALFGGVANDLLQGGPGDDRLFGGPGNDKLDGGPGRNVLDGGPGQDGVVVVGTAGDDNITVQRLAGNLLRVTINGVVRESRYFGETVFVFGGRGNDRIERLAGEGPPWKAEFYGQEGDDTLLGGVAGDVLEGGPGADTIQSQDGEADAIFADLADRLGLRDAMDRLLGVIRSRRRG